MAKKSELNFSEKMKRLQGIVDELEKEDLDLDKALKLYEEGLDLSKSLQDELKQYESKINKLNGEKDD